MHQISVPCTSCRRQLRLPGDIIGNTVRCPMCQAEFLTVDDGRGGAEAVPLALPSARGVPAEPPQPLLPALSLGDDLPALSLASEEPAPLSGASSPSPPPPPPNKNVGEAEKFRAVRFTVFVQKDPADKLEGRFQAEVDAQGMRLWRGSGRVILVPRGARALHKRGSRLAVEVEGRTVEFTVVCSRDASVLASQVADFLNGDAEKVEPVVGVAWPLVPIFLLPVGVPILAGTLGDNIGGPVGILAWSVLTLLLVFLGLSFAFRRQWSLTSRIVIGAMMVLFAYAGLVVGFIADRILGPGSVPVSAWTTMVRPDEGFRAMFPGAPRQEQAGHADFAPGTAFQHAVRVARQNATYAVLVAAYRDPARFDAKQRLSQATAQHLHFGVIHGRAVPGVPLPSPAPGIEAMEFTTAGPHLGSWGKARLYVSRQRLLLVTTGSLHVSSTHPDIQKFWTNFAFIPFAQKGDPAKPVPPAIPPKDTRDLGPGGVRLTDPKGRAIWAGVGPGGRVVAVNQNGQGATMDLGGRFPRPLFLPSSTVSSAALSPDGRWLAVADLNGRSLTVKDLRGAQRSFPTAGLSGKSMYSVAFSPDGKTLATAHGDRKFRLWDVEKGTIRAEVPSGTGQLLSVAFSPDNSLLAVGNADLATRLHDARTGALVRTLTGHKKPPAPFDHLRGWQWAIRSLAWSRDSRTLVSASNDATALVWDIGRESPVRTLPCPAAATASAFHPAGRLVAVGCGDGSVVVWEAATGVERGRFKLATKMNGHQPINSLAFDPEGKYLVAVASGQAECWEIERKVQIRPADKLLIPPARPPEPEKPDGDLAEFARIEPHTAAVIDTAGRHAFLFTPDRLLLHYSYPGFQLRSASWTGKLVKQAAFDPRGGHIVAVTVDPRTKKEQLAVFDVEAALAGRALPSRLQPRSDLEGPAKIVDLVAAGKWLFVLGADGGLARYDLATLRPVGEPKPSAVPQALALSGGKLYLGCGKKLLRMDADTLTEERVTEAGTHCSRLWAGEGKLVAVSAEGVAVFDRNRDEKPPLRYRMTQARQAWVRGDRLYVARFGEIRIYSLKGNPVDRPTSQKPGFRVRAVFLIAPDGRYAIAHGGAVLRLTGGRAEPRSVAPPVGRAPTASYQPHNRIVALNWSSTARRLLAAQADGQILTLDSQMRNGEVRRIARQSAPGWPSAAWGKDGKQPCWLDGSGRAKFHDGIIWRSLGGEGAALTGGALAADQKDGTVAFASAKGLSCRRQGGRLESLATLSPLTALAVADGTIAALAIDGKLRLFGTAPLARKATRDGHAAEGLALAISRDGKRIVSGDAAGMLLVWEPGKDRPERSLRAHDAPIVAVAISETGDWIATGAIDGSMKLWDARTGTALSTYPVRRGSPVWSLAFVQEGQTLVASVGMGLERFKTGRLAKPPAGGSKATIQRGFKFRVAALSHAGGFALVVLESGTMAVRHAFPAMRIEGLMRLEGGSCGLLLDRAANLAYVLRSTGGASTDLHPRGRGASLLVYDLVLLGKGLGKGKGPLTLRARAALDGTVFCPTLSPDGKGIFFLDAEKKRVVKLSTTTLKVSATLELKSAPLAASLSPDGKALYVLAEGNGGNAQVLAINPDRMAQTAATDLKQPAHDIAAGNGGIVVVAGRDRIERMIAGKVLRSAPAGGVRHRVQVAADGRTAFAFPEKAAPCVILVWPLDGSRGGRLTLPAGFGGTSKAAAFALSEDGSHLYSARGSIVTIPDRWLKKVAKP